MASIPADLQQLLDTAETDLEAARASDDAHQMTLDALTLAQDQEQKAHDAATTAHQKANTSASAFVDAIKKYFGIV